MRGSPEWPNKSAGGRVGVGRATKKEGCDHNTHRVLDIIVAKANKVYAILIPILPMGKPRHRKVKNETKQNKKLVLSHPPDK